MKAFGKYKYIFSTALLLVIVIGLSVVVVLGIGRVYKNRLSEYDSQAPIDSQDLIEKPIIKRMRFQKMGSEECIEVMPDGTVRVYKTCDGELQDFQRFNDPRSILDLYRLISEQDWSDFAVKGEGDYFELIIDTDQGTTTLYIPAGGGNAAADTILDTIDEVIENIPPTPTSSPLPSNNGSNQSPTPGSSASSLPSPFSSPSPGSSPTTDGDQGFTCDFYDATGNKKPYRVSNIVCSGEPSALP